MPNYHVWQHDPIVKLLAQCFIIICGIRREHFQETMSKVTSKVSQAQGQFPNKVRQRVGNPHSRQGGVLPLALSSEKAVQAWWATTFSQQGLPSSFFQANVFTRLQDLNQFSLAFWVSFCEVLLTHQVSVWMLDNHGRVWCMWLCCVGSLWSLASLNGENAKINANLQAPPFHPW